MPSLRITLLSLLSAVGLSHAEKLRVVWSAGSWSSISGPNGGSQSGHYSGFAVINKDGKPVYGNGTPGDHDACYNTGDGREFTISGSCWKTPITFHCKADFGGSPESCEVKDGHGKTIGSGEGQKDTDFIGIAIGTDATCVVEFESDGDCPVDDGSGPLHATDGCPAVQMDYGCDDGSCWKKCGPEGYNQWCWLAQDEGHGDWISCSAKKDCSPAHLKKAFGSWGCGRGEDCADCGCGCTGP